MDRSSIERLTAFTRNAALALFAATAGAAALSSIQNTEHLASGDATVLEIETEYDLSLYEYPEMFLGYTRDDMGPLGEVQAWSNIEGIAQKELIYQPPFPIRTELRKDALGYYFYIFMQDDAGNELAFDFSQPAIQVNALEPCVINKEDGAFFDFPGCPSPDSDEFHGAVSYLSSDGASFWNNPYIVREARQIADIMIFGKYCIGEVLGSQDPTDYTLFEKNEPNTKLAYNRYQQLVLSSIREQLAASMGIPLFDAYGLPTIRTMEEQMSIEEIIKLKGVEAFNDYESLSFMMFGYSDFDSTQALLDGTELKLNIGPSYSAQILDLEAQNGHVSMTDGDEPLVPPEDPESSKLNWFTCAPLASQPGAQDTIRALLRRTAEHGKNFGTPLVLLDGTTITNEQLQARYAELVRVRGEQPS